MPTEVTDAAGRLMRCRTASSKKDAASFCGGERGGDCRNCCGERGGDRGGDRCGEFGRDGRGEGGSSATCSNGCDVSTVSAFASWRKSCSSVDEITDILCIIAAKFAGLVSPRRVSTPMKKRHFFFFNFNFACALTDRSLVKVGHSTARGGLVRLLQSRIRHRRRAIRCRRKGCLFGVRKSRSNRPMRGGGG